MLPEIDKAAAILARSRKTAVLTGAGISRESGIPTFREAGGLWEKHRPEDLATVEGFLADPALVWRWYMERLFTARNMKPNPGHFALAKLETILPGFVLITQNIDDLHRKAGSADVIELHGNIERFKCLDGAHPAEYDPAWGEEPPLCHCGSIIRPDVVWFGEQLPEMEIRRAFSESALCDVMLVVGTSGLVSPASHLPLAARQGGADVIEVNTERSAITSLSGLFLEGRSGEVLPDLVSRIEEILEDGRDL
jgi:NAD-dependent deacetylase